MSWQFCLNVSTARILKCAYEISLFLFTGVIVFFYVGESVKYCKIANRQLLVKCYDNKTGVVTLQLDHLSFGLASGG